MATDAAPAPVAAEWGSPVNGVAVSLKADHFAWTADQQTTFTASARNSGNSDQSIFRSEMLAGLEVDGIRYHHIGTADVKSSAFPPGRQYDDLCIVADSAWCTGEGKKLQIAEGATSFASHRRSARCR